MAQIRMSREATIARPHLAAIDYGGHHRGDWYRRLGVRRRRAHLHKAQVRILMLAEFFNLPHRPG